VALVRSTTNVVPEPVSSFVATSVARALRVCESPAKDGAGTNDKGSPLRR